MIYGNEVNQELPVMIYGDDVNQRDKSIQSKRMTMIEEIIARVLNEM